jgi:protein SCO1
MSVTLTILSKFRYYWLLALVPLAFLAWYFLSAGRAEPLRRLPYYGPKGSAQPFSHVVPAFNFTDQAGERVTEKTVSGKIYISEFFFTTCRTICPVMNAHLDKIYKEFAAEHRILILSHTVDPETDSVVQLRRYAELHNVNDRRWLFLTGRKSELYEMARKGYLLSADEGSGGADDFVHTQNFALVDGNRRIRGFYDGTDSLEMVKMRRDIRVLLDEHEKGYSLHKP